MKAKRDLVHSLFKLLGKHLKDQEIAYNLTQVFLDKGSESLLVEIRKTYQNTREAFLEYLEKMQTADDLLIAFYHPDNERGLNDFIISHLESPKLKQYLLNQQNNRLTALSRTDKIFNEEPVELLEGLVISGDIFTRSQEILREVNYQHSFIFLWKHFVYLFQDQIDHKNLAIWISTFTLLKNQEEIQLEEFLEANPINPFRNLIEMERGIINVANLLAFIYSFWPLVLLVPEHFFAYTTRALAPYVKGLDTLETLRVISLVKSVKIEELLEDPRVCLKGKGDFNYESSQFHQIFLGVSKEEKKRAGTMISDFIEVYTEKALPLVLKYKTPDDWRSYATSLSFAQKTNLISPALIENSFSYKLLQEDFWQSFEEILNFQPFESLKSVNNELLALFPETISTHINRGKKIWGSSWFGFYVIASSLPDSNSFQGFLKYFKTLSPQVQSHKLIYYMSSVMLPDYNHFLFVYRVLAYLNVANNPDNVLKLLEDPKERELILNLSKQSSDVDWINSSIVIHSLRGKPTLLEHLSNKLDNFSISDLEYFDPYSPVFLWLFWQSGKPIENATLIHPQRSSFSRILNYWKKNNSNSPENSF